MGIFDELKKLTQPYEDEDEEYGEDEEYDEDEYEEYDEDGEYEDADADVE